MPKRETCPDCQGEGHVGPVFLNYGGERPNEVRESMPCGQCNGAGVITPERAEALAIGRAAKKARAARGESLLEAAKRLGTTPADLSAAERGRIPHPERLALSGAIKLKG